MADRESKPQARNGGWAWKSPCRFFFDTEKRRFVAARTLSTLNGCLKRGRLTGQAGTVEGEAVDRAENGGGDLFGTEEFLGQDLHFFARDCFDGRENFVERIEATEVQLLTSESGHAGAGGLKGKHQRALE